MPYLLQNEIESIAQRVLRAYCNLQQIQGQTISRIEPELLAKNLLNLNVEYHLLSVSGSILGMTAQNRNRIKVYDKGPKGELCLLGKKTVFIDRYLHDDPGQSGRYHFTLMHEASHHILWMLFPARTAEIAERRVHYCLAHPVFLEDEERYANALTSAILMPPQLLLRKMAEQGLGTHIRILNRIYDPKGYARFSEIASSLGVSKTALCIRMKQLGMLEKEYLKDPYALFEIMVDEEDMAYFS